MRAMRRGTGPWPFPLRTTLMAYDSGKRLLLYALANFAALRAWNAAPVYQQAIAVIGRQIDGASALR